MPRRDYTQPRVHLRFISASVQITIGAATGKVVEVQVNPEFSVAEALAVTEKYSREIGRLPAFLLTDVDTVWIHRGNQGFGGGNRDKRITHFLINDVLKKICKILIVQNI